MDDEVRRLEREAQAAPRSAAAWGELARALARAGRGWDAHGAAARALALSPGASDLRALLVCPPGGPWAPSASWPGLRRLDPPRAVEVGHDVDAVVDLGGGRVLACGPAALTVVDLVTRTTGWSVAQRRAGPPWPSGGLPVVAGGTVVSIAGLGLERHTASTGERRGPIDLQPTDLVGDDPSLEDVDLDLVALDARVVAHVSRGRAVTWVDVVDGRVVARVPLDEGAPPGADLADEVGPSVAADGLLVIESRGACLALASDGQRRWRIEADARGPARAVAAAPGALLVGRPGAHGQGLAHLVVVDPATGEERLRPGTDGATFTAAVLTRPAVVTVRGERVEGWDRTDGRLRWSQALGPDDLLLSATADVALVTAVAVGRGWLGPTASQGPTVGLDAATGARLWQHRPVAGDAPPRPVAGHLVAVGQPRGLVRTRTPVWVCAPAGP